MLVAGILGGILLGGIGVVVILALPDKTAGATTSEASTPMRAVVAAPPSKTLSSQLDELTALHSQGKISDEELKAARSKLLGG